MTKPTPKAVAVGMAAFFVQDTKAWLEFRYAADEIIAAENRGEKK